MVEVKVEQDDIELHSHRLYGEKTRSLESQIARKCKKNQRQHERKLYDS